MAVGEVGAVCFGVVVGWIVYRTLRRTSDEVRLSDIATVVGAVGGEAVTTLFNNESLFGCYSIGLAGGLLWLSDPRPHGIQGIYVARYRKLRT